MNEFTKRRGNRPRICKALYCTPQPGSSNACRVVRQTCQGRRGRADQGQERSARGRDRLHARQDAQRRTLVVRRHISPKRRGVGQGRQEQWRQGRQRWHAVQRPGRRNLRGHSRQRRRQEAVLRGCRGSLRQGDARDRHRRAWGGGFRRGAGVVRALFRRLLPPRPPAVPLRRGRPRGPIQSTRNEVGPGRQTGGRAVQTAVQPLLVQALGLGKANRFARRRRFSIGWKKA